MFHRGGGNKRKYRVVDFFRRVPQEGYIVALIKDSRRSSFLHFVRYDNGLLSLIYATDGVLVGSKIASGVTDKQHIYSTTVGTAGRLNCFNLFTTVSNVESFPFSVLNWQEQQELVQF